MEKSKTKYLLLAPALIISCIIPIWFGSSWSIVGLFVLLGLIVPVAILALQAAGLISSILQKNRTLIILFSIELLMDFCLVALAVYNFIHY